MTIANLATVRVAAGLVGPQGDDLVNVFEFRNDTGSAVPYADAIASLRAGLGDLYASSDSIISSSVHAGVLSFWDVALEAPMGIWAWDTFTGGSDNSGPLPPQVAGFIFFRTHRSRCIGKKFIPGPCEDHNDGDGYPGSLYLAALTWFGENLVGLDTDVDWDGWQFVVRSTVDHLLYVPYYIVASQKWSTVRRRRFGSGS